MIFLILFLLADFCAVAHYEKKTALDANIDQMVKSARYHEMHPEIKRSVKYMKAGYML